MNYNHYIIIALGAVILVSLAILIVRGRKSERSRDTLTVTKGTGIPLRRRIGHLFGHKNISDEFWSELEATLIQADAGLNVTERLLTSARGLGTTEDVKRCIAEEMISMLSKNTEVVRSKPLVTLVLGVNGVGKTTTIAKLAKHNMDEGKRVLLVACDTFRAAAVEQLSLWASSIGCEVVSQAMGADAAAVAFDGVTKACAKDFDAVILDTAGRLHTKSNLMEELKKIDRVIGRALPGAPHEKLLVIDATVGANGLAQASEFNKALGLTGAIVTKLDGTAKGGVVLAVASELGIPIAHIGVGEKIEDLRPFDAKEYVEAILG
ncbi:MAG: signal recognition particle-docking protein FtsY [Pseudomonadota bacterium]